MFTIILHILDKKIATKLIVAKLAQNRQSSETRSVLYQYARL